MALSKISIKDYDRFILNVIRNLEINRRISLLTFKKDRKISILRLTEELFSIEEEGFKIRTFENLDKHQLIKISKKLKDIEFPRSNILYVK